MDNLVILYDNQDDFFYEFKLSNFSLYNLVDCSTIDFNQFLKIQLPNLFGKRLSLFYNAQDLDKDFLLNFIENEKLNGNILAFNGLDKRTKLYKKIISSFELKNFYSIKTNPIKKDFIKTILIENKLNINLLEFFVSILPENKLIIDCEIKKFKQVYDSCKDLDIAKKSVSPYLGNTDLFELLNSLFSRSNSRFYFFLNKVILDINPMHISALLLKKLLYYILLSKGDELGAKRCINAADYIIKKDKFLAKKLGFKFLTDFYVYCDASLNYYNTNTDQYNNKDIRLILLEIYNYFNLKSSS